MLKSFYKSFIALLLVIAVLGPTAMSLYHTDSDSNYIVEMNGEENNEQQTEKTLDKKELFFEQWVVNSNFTALRQQTINSSYRWISISYETEIVLPPPKGRI